MWKEWMEVYWFNLRMVVTLLSTWHLVCAATKSWEWSTPCNSFDSCTGGLSCGCSRCDSLVHFCPWTCMSWDRRYTARTWHHQPSGSASYLQHTRSRQVVLGIDNNLAINHSELQCHVGCWKRKQKTKEKKEHWAIHCLIVHTILYFHFKDDND